MQTLLPSERYKLCSNSFENPVVYALRIPEFREAMVLCCYERPTAGTFENNLCGNKKTLVALTPGTELRT